MAQTEEERKAKKRAYYEAHKEKWKTPEFKEKQRIWQEANRPALREYARRAHQRHKEARNARSNAWGKANPDKVRASARRRQGIIDAPGEKRHGECPICLRTLELVCDHWHHGPKKGQVRGWPCRTCNLMLGYAFDSSENLDRAKAYIRLDDQD